MVIRIYSLAKSGNQGRMASQYLKCLATFTKYPYDDSSLQNLHF